MERKEAIGVVKRNYPHVAESGSQFETALRILIPELKESEDEKMRKKLIAYFKNLSDVYSLEPLEINPKKAIAWLEKQGEQKPAEWSKEDEQYLLVCKNALAKYQVSDKWDSRVISCWLENKLKALQKQWKPSKEQIRRLEYFLKLWGKTKDTEYTKVFETVKSLYNDLKKLREE